MARPNVPQGTLNRLRAQVVWTDFPALSITSSFLLPEAIEVSFEGAVTDTLPTLTGFVTSPSPFLMARMMIHLNRAQGFANVWKQQIETTSILGPCTVYPDSPTMDPFLFDNSAIGAPPDRISFAGRDAGFSLNIVASWQINASLWS